MRPRIVRALPVFLVVLALPCFLFGQKRLSSGSQQTLTHKVSTSPATSHVVRGAVVLPANTTDSWTGSGDGTSWNNASNWSAGVPNSSTVDVTIGTTTAAVNDNINASVGKLTLSHAGDSLTIGNNLTLSVFGSSINNAGTITLGSTGNGTFLAIDAAIVTLSGGGNVVLGTSVQFLGASTAGNAAIVRFLIS